MWRKTCKTLCHDLTCHLFRESSSLCRSNSASHNRNRTDRHNIPPRGNDVAGAGIFGSCNRRILARAGAGRKRNCATAHRDGCPIRINFAISGIDRVVRELSAARHRRNKEIGISRQFAEQTLRNELKGTMTALLLSCEMALQVTTLPPDAEARIRTAYLLAQEMRTRLGIAA